jgi:hypothetical protein
LETTVRSGKIALAWLGAIADIFHPSLKKVENIFSIIQGETQQNLLLFLTNAVNTILIVVRDC